MTIEGFGVVDVLVDDIAGEVDAGEEALGARVGEELGIGEFGGGGLGVAADGTGGRGDVTAQLQLVVEDIVGGFAVDADEDEIGGLTADLQTEAGAGHLDKDGRGPAVAGAAGSDTLTILGTHEERTLLEAGNDDHAVGFGRDVEGDAFVGGSHELVQDGVGGINALIELGGVLHGRRRSDKAGSEADGDEGGCGEVAHG